MWKHFHRCGNQIDSDGPEEAEKFVTSWFFCEFASVKNAVSGSRAPKASVGGVWNSSQRPKLISSQRNGLAGSDSHVTFAREGWPGLAERTTEANPQQRILCCRSPSFIQWLFVVWCLSESNIFFIVATFSRTIRATGHRICATEMTTTRSISNGTMTDLCKLVLFFLDFSTAGLFGHVLYQGHLIHLWNIHQGGKFGQNQSGGNSPAFVA